MFDPFEKGILKFKKGNQVSSTQAVNNVKGFKDDVLSFGPSSERMETCP